MTTSDEEIDWTALLGTQLDWHWEAQLRPRLEGLSDAEYFFEPVAGCWSVRAEGEGSAPEQVGSGPMRIDFGFPPPEPAPVTTIAWRLGHLVVGVFGERNARYFDGPDITYDGYAYPATAGEALAALDQGYARWTAGVAALTPADLRANCREPGFESDSMAALILHINREVLHHGAEIALLRDLWAHGARSAAA